MAIFIGLLGDAPAANQGASWVDSMGRHPHDRFQPPFAPRSRESLGDVRVSAVGPARRRRARPHPSSSHAAGSSRVRSRAIASISAGSSAPSALSFLASALR